MRFYPTILAACLLVLCGCGTVPVSQEKDVLVGKINRADLSERWLTSHEQAPIDPPFVEMIRQAQEGVDVVVFIGTWCSDSRREVPRFLRIADEVGMDQTRYTLYALDRMKSSPEGMEKTYVVDRVPTFIFLREGKEIGRIVESPRTTLEGDILTILVAANS
ncbi:MAG: thioredoxin family protein [Bacteroidetes bacterium]|nr:thioredoxin family protein [Bacteroidota bacterium]